MQSKIRFLYHADGRLENVTQADYKVFQGSVAATEFILAVEQGWLPTDTIFICLTRPNEKTPSCVRMSYDLESGTWQYLSNGWLEDKPFAGSETTFKVSFRMHRYSSIDETRLVSAKTTEELTLPIYASASYTPLDIGEDNLSKLLQDLTSMEHTLQYFDEFQVGDVKVNSLKPTQEASAKANIEKNVEKGAYQLNMELGIPKGDKGDTGENGVSIIGASLVQIN